MLLFVQPDHLGSAATITGENGVVVGRDRYRAFGERRWVEEPSSTEYLYTGQRFNALVGLCQYSDGTSAGRFYDATIGRFVNPDSIIPDDRSTQALNRYSYVFNNPLRLTDPSGYLPAMSDQWKSSFIGEHGYDPSEQDWWDYNFSLEYPMGGGWSDQAWEATYHMRARLYLSGMEFTHGGSARWTTQEIDEIDAVVARFGDSQHFGSTAKVKEKLGAELRKVRGATFCGDENVPACASGRLIEVNDKAHTEEGAIYSFADYVVHEFGHVLDSTSPGFVGYFGLGTVGFRGPTQYSREGAQPSEKFAESFMVWMGYGKSAMERPLAPQISLYFNLFRPLR